MLSLHLKYLVGALPQIFSRSILRIVQNSKQCSHSNNRLISINGLSIDNSM